eukprot:4921385-Pleurochrysis_carterae.AAC.1
MFVCGGRYACAIGDDGVCMHYGGRQTTVILRNTHQMFGCSEDLMCPWLVVCADHVEHGGHAVTATYEVSIASIVTWSTTSSSAKSCPMPAPLVIDMHDIESTCNQMRGEVTIALHSVAQID